MNEGVSFKGNCGAALVREGGGEELRGNGGEELRGNLV